MSITCQPTVRLSRRKYNKDPCARTTLEAVHEMLTRARAFDRSSGLGNTFRYDFDEGSERKNSRTPLATDAAGGKWAESVCYFCVGRKNFAPGFRGMETENATRPPAGRAIEERPPGAQTGVG